MRNGGGEDMVGRVVYPVWIIGTTDRHRKPPQGFGWWWYTVYVLGEHETRGAILSTFAISTQIVTHSYAKYV